MDTNIAGTYFNFIQGMVASSVVLTVLVLNYHHRNPDTHNMPPWVGALYLKLIMLYYSQIRCSLKQNICSLA